MKKNFLYRLLIFSIIASFTSCYYDVEEELYPGGCALDENKIISYSIDVEPIFVGNCNVCHSAASGNQVLDNYTSLSAYLLRADNELSCRIEGSDCGDRMPQGGELSCYNIKLINQWIEQGYPEN